MACAATNVVVNRHSQKPFIDDFSQCNLKAELIRSWKDLGWMYDKDDPDVEYWKAVMMRGNHIAIGVMPKLMKRKKGMELNTEFLDHEEILDDMKRRRGIKSEAKIKNTHHGDDD
ncbi:hypothetical protein C8A00DRAFT_32087 [Chaetomidium leptoderma]|uniref:Uncharacterized protein n=1 Tax=Chaetomidium leptoderma TaxID=669021 RepID=A0AAN6VPN5_9PEZI|nr:hypothetical protein C8A00DRAFT_32087 [Chaetomidium leptoderma]